MRVRVRVRGRGRVEVRLDQVCPELLEQRRPGGRGDNQRGQAGRRWVAAARRAPGVISSGGGVEVWVGIGG